MSPKSGSRFWDKDTRKYKDKACLPKVAAGFGIKTRANIRTKRVSQKWKSVWPTLLKLVLGGFGIKTRQSKDLEHANWFNLR